MAEPGWYKDWSDPALARWHDGSAWTEHTVVIADQSPGWVPASLPTDAPPPPPGSPAGTLSDPTQALPVTPATSVAAAAADAGVDGAEDAERPWFKKKPYVLPLALVALLIGIGAVAGGDEDDDPSDVTTTTEEPEVDPMEEAVDIAQASLTVSFSDREVENLIRHLCASAEEADPESFAARLAAEEEVRTDAQARATIEAVGEGAEEYCPDDVADEPALLNQIYAAYTSQASSTTTTPATTPTTTPPTTAPPTTQRPAPVVPPPPTQPPATSPPAPSPGGAYANCTEARNAGAAPVYRGDPGYGPHLDRDNDGIGCE
jgi:hypothetical protein